jgi:hypothetical protein
LNEKCNLQLLKDFRRSAIRDFRIESDKITEALEAMSDAADKLPAAKPGRKRSGAGEDGGAGRKRRKTSAGAGADEGGNDEGDGGDDE